MDPVRTFEGAAAPKSTPAGFWVRFLAAIIDGIIIMVITSILRMPLLLLLSRVPFMALSGYIGLYLVVIYFYMGWFYQNRGGTPGKLLLNLRVVDFKTGSYISYGRTFGRETVGKFISAVPLYLGFIIAGLRDDKRGFHDMIFDTQVIRRNT